ncbi:MAG: HyaD/HybD family hydrogenase maturation endopeptidase [Gammaproteobacteria bacterium]
MNTLVLGLGNVLLGDEGIGVHVVQSMQETHKALDNVTFLDGGTLSFTLAGYIEQADNLIIVDAAQLNEAPGIISVFEGDDMDRFINKNRHKSVHEVNITDILALSHLTGDLPTRRALVGIQPLYIDWSNSLSQPLADAISPACEITHDLIRKWHQSGD